MAEKSLIRRSEILFDVQACEGRKRPLPAVRSVGFDARFVKDKGLSSRPA